jgi:hypothetical protein
MKVYFAHGNVNGKIFTRQVNGEGKTFPISVPREDPLNLHATIFSYNS